MKYIILKICFALVFFCGCNQGKSDEDQKAELETHVMEVHDDAMEKMSKIYHLRRDLRALRDTLEAQQVDTSKLVPLQASIRQLNEADEAMMNWMRQYKAPVSLKHDQAMEYLQKELGKIRSVQNLMDSTISIAQETYENYKQEETF